MAFKCKIFEAMTLTLFLGHFTHECTVSKVFGINKEIKICFPNKKYIIVHWWWRKNMVAKWIAYIYILLLSSKPVGLLVVYCHQYINHIWDTFLISLVGLLLIPVTLLPLRLCMALSTSGDSIGSSLSPLIDSEKWVLSLSMSFSVC